MVFPAVTASDDTAFLLMTSLLEGLGAIQLMRTSKHQIGKYTKEGRKGLLTTHFCGWMAFTLPQFEDLE